MIDLHSHILPGLDDGAKTLEDSIAMLEMAAAAGTTDIVATSHANIEYSFDPELARAKIAEVQAACDADIRIHYGCEVHLTLDNIQSALAQPGKYSIAHKGYILVEFSDFSIPKSTSQILRQMFGAGLRPIVAHPERNPMLQHRLSELMDWVDMGCLVQVTAASYNGRFGRTAKVVSDELMKNGYVHVVASDGHDVRHRPPVLNDAWDHVVSQYGEETANAIFVENPRAVLAGVPLPAGPIAVRKKKWYQRF